MDRARIPGSIEKGVGTQPVARAGVRERMAYVQLFGFLFLSKSVTRKSDPKERSLRQLPQGFSHIQ